MGTARPEAFERFFREAEPRLRRGLAAIYDGQIASDATAEALAWAWQHFDRVEGFENPIGYLFRVGQTAARRSLARTDLPLEEAGLFGTRELPQTDPHVVAILASMSHHQRVAVLLVHGYGYRHHEVAELLECAPSTVANHVQRGLEKLRDAMGVVPNA